MPNTKAVKKKPIHKRRPTETTTGAVGVAAALIAQIVGVNDADTVAAIAVVLGLLPSVVTYVVTLVRGE